MAAAASVTGNIFKPMTCIGNVLLSVTVPSYVEDTNVTVAAYNTLQYFLSTIF